MRAGAPTSVTTIGPSSAKPMANAALRVSVNTPFAEISCRRGTTCGIIAASAGAKNTVTVEIRTLNSIRSSRVGAGQEQGDREPGPQEVGATRTTRLSKRST